MQAIVLLALLGLVAVSQAARCDGSPGSADGRCCFACELIVNELVFEDATNHITSADQAKAALERACNRVGMQFEDHNTCLMWVDANYQAIYMQVDGAVKNHTRPNARRICVSINECPTKSIAKRSVVSVIEPKARCDGSAGSADMRCCFACEIIINELAGADFMNHIQNADDAKAELERACNRVGQQFEDHATCVMWVDANYQAIYMQVDAAVKNRTRPHARTICVSINECPSGRIAKRSVVSVIEPKVHVIEPKAREIEPKARCDGSAGSADMRCCFACEIIINELAGADFMNHIQNADDAKAELERACNRVGMQFEDHATCVMWVDANYQAIYMQVDAAVKNRTRPHARTICVSINECPSGRLAKRSINSKESQCSICGNIFDSVKKQLPTSGKITEEMIKGLVLKAGKKSAAYTSVRHTIFDRLLAVSFHIGKERSNFDSHKMCEHVQLC